MGVNCFATVCQISKVGTCNGSLQGTVHTVLVWDLGTCLGLVEINLKKIPLDARIVRYRTGTSKGCVASWRQRGASAKYKHCPIQDCCSVDDMLSDRGTVYRQIGKVWVDPVDKTPKTSASAFLLYVERFIFGGYIGYTMIEYSLHMRDCVTFCPLSRRISTVFRGISIQLVSKDLQIENLRYRLHPTTRR